jgi:hypothetical protein
MTRRERLERKAERRREWAAKAETRSNAAFDSARRVADGIPLGQPILVGHHSEKHHRRDISRIDSGMRRGCEEADKAKDHVSKAGGIEHQLERSIFSDDVDALEQLHARIEELEQARAWHTAVNRAFRKAPGVDAAAKLTELVVSKVLTQEQAMGIAKSMSYSWDKANPFPAYVNANLGNRIRADRERIKAIQARAQRTAEAEAAGGVSITKHGTAGEWAAITFAEKPARAIIDALKAAGFHWSGGSWHGPADKIPEGVTE